MGAPIDRQILRIYHLLSNMVLPLKAEATLIFALSGVIIFNKQFLGQPSMASFGESYSLLESPRRSHEKVEHADLFMDSEHQRDIIRRPDLLRLLHSIYTITITFVLAILSAQSILSRQLHEKCTRMTGSGSYFGNSEELSI